MKTNKDCVFCKIINGEIGQLEFENDFVVAFKTLEPKAKIHLLIVPKKHIVSLSETTNDDKDLLGEMMIVARDLAVKYHLENGYRIIINNGQNAGQSIKHLHLHLLGGEKLTFTM